MVINISRGSNSAVSHGIPKGWNGGETGFKFKQIMYSRLTQQVRAIC